jgi:D-alanine transaminase
MLKPLGNLNGSIKPLAEVMVPALDRGFLFGDAVYEGMHFTGGKVRFFDRHLARLERSLRELRIGPIDLPRLRGRIEDTIRQGEFGEAFIYVQITRGAGPSRTHHFPPAGTLPTEFFFVEEFKDPYGPLRETGVAVVTQPDLRWHRCDVKSTNLLGNVLAFQASKEQGGYEALLLRPDGTVTEGARTSFFGVIDGRIRTGPLTPAILPGVTRGVVLELIRELKLPVEERHVMREELPQAEELFLTGTTAEVLPIVTVDNRKVGEGKPGPITRKLQAAFRELVRL